MQKLKTIFYNWWYLRHPQEMVKYWKSKEAVRAKVTTAKDGSYQMWLEGEKYPFPGFPRGTLLLTDEGYTGLSVLKHSIKNFIFNESWNLLEQGKDIVQRIKTEGLRMILNQITQMKYDMLPPERMTPAVREIYRAFTVVAKRDKRIEGLRDAMTFVLQEDDGYRFRVQWLATYMLNIEKGLNLMEHAEVIDDMKERIRLLRRILLAVLKDKHIKELYDQFCREVNWKKIKLTKADKYYFRAKYFKCDYPNFSY